MKRRTVRRVFNLQKDLALVLSVSLLFFGGIVFFAVHSYLAPSLQSASVATYLTYPSSRVANVFAFTTENWVTQNNVQYEPDIDTSNSTTLDITYDSTHTRPLVVFVHGGGWHDGDKAQAINTIGKTFVVNGYSFAALNYHLLELDSHFRPIAHPVASIPVDLAHALSFLYQHAATYHISHVVLVGHSAGAHLVALLLTNPDYLNSVSVPRTFIQGEVLLDGHVYSIPKVIAEGRSIFASQVGPDLTTQNLASPVYFITNQTSATMPPTFIISGIDCVATSTTCYHPIPKFTQKQAVIFANTLTSKSNIVRHLAPLNQSHADFYNNLMVANNITTVKILAFLKQYLQ